MMKLRPTRRPGRLPGSVDRRADGPTPVPASGPTALRRLLARWRRLLTIGFTVAVMVAFAVLLFRARSDLVTAAHHVGVRSLPWLAAAVGAEAVSFLCYAAVQLRLLRAGGAHLRLRTMVGLTVAATGLTNLVPGGTAPASGWLVTQYRRHGVPLSLAVWAVLAGGLAAGASVLALLLSGAAIAGFLGVWAAVGCAVLLFAGVTGVVTCAHHVPVVDAWLDRHRSIPGAGAARRFTVRLGEVVRFRISVRGGMEVFALSLGNWGMDVVCLAAGFAVVGFAVPWRALLFAYAVAQVAGSLAPVPGGVGFVEGGMLGAFALAGTPLGHAVVAIVIYRLITTWGMAGLGSAMLLVVNHRRPAPAVLRGRAADVASGDKDDD